MSDSLNTGTNTTDTGTQQTATEAPADATTATTEASAANQQQAASTTEAPAVQPGTEAKPDGDKGTKKGDEGKPQGAPEKYEFKAPEGQTFNPDVLTEFESVARDLNLPQEAAQKLLDKMGPKIAATQMENFQRVQNEWAESAKTDKEFGGEKLTENLAIGKKALDQFGTPELRTLLNESGLGNHPEVIRAFVKVGKAISEDRIVPGGPGKGPQTGGDVASKLYPNQAKSS